MTTVVLVKDDLKTKFRTVLRVGSQILTELSLVPEKDFKNKVNSTYKKLVELIPMVKDLDALDDENLGLFKDYLDILDRVKSIDHFNKAYLSDSFIRASYTRMFIEFGQKLSRYKI